MLELIEWRKAHSNKCIWSGLNVCQESRRQSGYEISCDMLELIEWRKAVQANPAIRKSEIQPMSSL